MSSKKRVYDLAKEYGMTGQALAAKLKQFGITEVKGAMSALDEFLLLRVQATLEANGIIPESKSITTVESSGGLTVRKKKKKKKVAPPPEPEPEPQAESEPEPADTEPEPEPAPHATVPDGAVPIGEAAPVEVPPEPATIPEQAPAVEAPDESPAETPAAASAEAPVEIAAEPEPLAVEPAAATEPVLEPEPARAQADKAVESELPAAAETPAEAVATTPEGVPTEDKPRIVRPAARRRPGKVVGFVDLSKVQPATTAKRPESRRLRSKDDVAPDVMPTLGHDRRRALMRGDHASRGQLTAAQLREKEAGRFLRRKGLGGATAPRGPRGPRAAEFAGSPLAGGEVTITSPITIKKLGEALSVKANQVVGKAFTSLGLPVTINSNLDDETAQLLALEFQVAIKIVHEVEAEDALIEELVKKRTAVEEADLVTRPPTVAFLGHVDHGKTTLLDRIRDSRVASGESGGITQHIGAYQVETASGNPLTIIDTPGHEAFTAMRARGAQSVDIVVLVIAADDGVMPSTLEAINHARAAKVPMVVALNKIDKPEANADRVKQQLTAHDMLAEDYGGDVAMIPVSALNGQGVEELLERVFLESEVLELKAHARGPATGIVLEAEKHEGKGPVAYLLIKDGTLSRGDVILAGDGYGKVRSIHDDRGRSIKTAGPSKPVEVSGLTELPSVGDQFHVVGDLKKAKEVAEERSRKIRMTSLAERQSVTRENLLQAVADQQKKNIDVIIKADVQGSLQALSQQLESLTHEEVAVRVVHAAIGAVTESDVSLAIPTSALVLAFHVGVLDKGRVLADRSGIEIRPYEVIYELLDDMRAMMEGSLAPEMTEEITGHAEVRAVFKSSRLGNIAGCYILDGSVFRDSKVRVKRGDQVLHTGAVSTLKREKDDAKEVRESFECGIVLKDFDAFELGDVIEAYKVVAVKRLLKI